MWTGKPSPRGSSLPQCTDVQLGEGSSVVCTALRGAGEHISLTNLHEDSPTPRLAQLQKKGWPGVVALRNGAQQA